MNVFAGQDGDADTENRLVDTGVQERVGQIESDIETDTLPNGKQIANGNLLCDARSSKWCSVIIYRGRKEWEVGGMFKWEGTYVYLWPIHVDAWQKPTQYCKATIH